MVTYQRGEVVKEIDEFNPKMKDKIENLTCVRKSDFLFDAEIKRVSNIEEKVRIAGSLVGTKLKKREAIFEWQGENFHFTKMEVLERVEGELVVGKTEWLWAGEWEDSENIKSRGSVYNFPYTSKTVDLENLLDDLYDF